MSPGAGLGVRFSNSASAIGHKYLYANRSVSGSMSSFGSSFRARSSRDLKSGEGSGAVGGLSREQLRAWAREVGFDEAGLVAIPHLEEDRDAIRFEEWLRAGRAGTMRYLERVD